MERKDEEDTERKCAQGKISENTGERFTLTVIFSERFVRQI